PVKGVGTLRSFEPGFIARQPVTQEIIKTIRIVGEYKGKQASYRDRAPQLLETLRTAAIVSSTESSNRIEGITAPAARVAALVAHGVPPRNRSEQEIAGYRDVLNTIHANHEHMPFNTGVVLQMHRDLYRFTTDAGGQWKDVDNQIVEFLPDDSKRVRFTPVPAHLTGEAMESLHLQFNEAWNARDTEPLLLVATYVLDFLCIHPFRDGNGRMARLLSLLLLYRAGYDIGRYMSLEQIVEKTRESYYDTLYRSSIGWHDGRHSLTPWWEYFLGVMLLQAYRELDARVESLTSARGAKTRMVVDAIAALPPSFRLSEVERCCPGASRPTINRVVAALRKAGRLKCSKPGRNAVWEKKT
ncbi:MAG: Fic family protein, partial [Bacillota bacterium]